MKLKLLFSFSLLCLALSASAWFNATRWQIADGYEIHFSTGGADGIFKTMSGVISFDAANPGASGFDVTIDVNSINTGNGMKNNHAKGEDFFNAKQYPSIHFVSSRIEKSGAGYRASGKLTIKATTKDVVVPFSFVQNGNTGLFRCSFSVNRKDYDLQRSGVGETVAITVSVPVKK